MKLKDILAAACAFALVAVAPAFAAKTLIKNNVLASYYGAQFHGRPTSSGEVFDMYGMTAAHRTLPFGTMLEITNLENGNSAVVRVNDRGPFEECREIDVSLGAAEKLGMIASGVARVSIAVIDDIEPASGMPANAAALPPKEPAAALPVQAAQAAAGGQEGAVSAEPIPPAPPSSLSPLPADAGEAAAEARIEPAAVAQQSAPSSENSAIDRSPPVWRVQLGAFMREENAIRLVRQIRAVGIEPSYERTGDTTRVVIAGLKDSELESVKSVLEGAGIYDYIIRRER